LHPPSIPPDHGPTKTTRPQKAVATITHDDKRRITIDTSRVALALSRTRIMGARYPFYTLKDSPDGQVAEAKMAGSAREAADAGFDVVIACVFKSDAQGQRCTATPAGRSRRRRAAVSW
jgi:hypothetical protein